MIILIGYGSNNNRLRIYEKMDWMVSHSDLMHLPQRILLSIHKSFELEL